MLREPRARAVYDARRAPVASVDYDSAVNRARGAAFDRVRRGAAAADASVNGGNPIASVMRIVELALRPRSLLGASLLFGGAWWFMDAVGGGTTHDGTYGDASGASVPAWWNAEAGRWETPAPWAPNYAAARHTTRLVKRSLVSISHQPGGASCGASAVQILVPGGQVGVDHRSAPDDASATLHVTVVHADAHAPPHTAANTAATNAASSTSQALAAARSGRSEIVLR